ncbi:MAG: hypothetical protein A4E73_00467 [Syntrophaceae bacterium PtaU1.Bin231]|nr:MAG: hypothetical protein A4E73_00467 [Syntrophaceae bacterium PtaU1.Bin231]
MDGLRQRSCPDGLVPGRAWPRRLEIPGNVVSMAVRAIHRTHGPQPVRRGGGVVFPQECGAGMPVVELENIDGRGREPRHVLGDIGVVLFPVGVFLLEQGKAASARQFGRLAASRMAQGAVGDIDRLRAEELHGLPAGRHGAALFVPELNDRALVRLKVFVRDGSNRASSRAVVEGRQGQSQGVPQVRGRQRQRHVPYLRDEGVREDDVSAPLPRIIQVSAEEILSRRAGIDVHGQLPADAEPQGRVGIVRKRARGIPIEEEVGPHVVGDAVTRISGGTVSVRVLGDPPVLHLVAFAVAVVFHEVRQSHPVVRRQQPGFFTGRTGPDDLGLDAVVGRDDAAIGDVEAHAVHAQFVVDEDVVWVERPVDGSAAWGRRSCRRGREFLKVERWSCRGPSVHAGSGRKRQEQCQYQERSEAVFAHERFLFPRLRLRTPSPGRYAALFHRRTRKAEKELSGACSFA